MRLTSFEHQGEVARDLSQDLMEVYELLDLAREAVATLEETMNRILYGPRSRKGTYPI